MELEKDGPTETESDSEDMTEVVDSIPEPNEVSASNEPEIGEYFLNRYQGR